jgi:hypothetical protein
VPVYNVLELSVFVCTISECSFTVIPLSAHNFLSFLQNMVNLLAYIHCNKWQWSHRALNYLGNKNNSQYSHWLSSTDFIGLVWLLLRTNKKLSNSYFLLDVLVPFFSRVLQSSYQRWHMFHMPYHPNRFCKLDNESLKHLLQLIQLHWII